MVLLLVLFVVLLDRITKTVISCRSDILPLEVIDGVFSVNVVHNTGGAFGMFKGIPIAFIVFSTIAVIIISVLLMGIARKMPGRRWYRVSLAEFSLALILGGAIGNLTDRMAYGYVIDFLDFKIWPVFNLADSAVCVGAALLTLMLLFKKRHNTGV